MLDLQAYLDNAVAASRQKRLAKSDQLTLGEMILKLEPMIANQKEIKKEYDHEAKVVFDFEYLYPTGIDSWRGIYAELALSFGERDEGKMTVTQFRDVLKTCIGKTFTGYKGGDFEMSKHTPVWVANYGNSGNTAVIEIVDNEYEVIIMTGYRES